MNVHIPLSHLKNWNFLEKNGKSQLGSFAASNPQPRPNLLPRRDFPAHAPLPGVAALVPRALTPGYQALAPFSQKNMKKNEKMLEKILFLQV